MRKIILICALLLFVCVGCVSAGNNTNATYDNQIIYDIQDSDNVTYATEDGHANITFDNGYNGYCIEYGEHDAKIDDLFFIENASDIRNNPSNKDVSNYLKNYFVYHYDYMNANPAVYTQHVIWHYTDDFSHHITTPSWLIESINKSAENNKISDDGMMKYNDTHIMIYHFISLISPNSDNQNFIGYQISFQNIPNETISNNITINNTSNNTDITNNTIINETNKIININEESINVKHFEEDEVKLSSNVSNYIAGNPLAPAAIAILLILSWIVIAILIER